MTLTDIKTTPEIAKYVSRTLRSINKEMNRFGDHHPVQVRQLTENKFAFNVDFKCWLRPETILDVEGEFKDAITAADREGHVHLVELGNGHGPEFVEAMLSGLRPGMKLTAEAFFPTIEFEVTWKKITSKRSR